MDFNDSSIVDFFKTKSVSDCGYCKSECSSHTYGMWADVMTVMDYQNLIDRGWRRCGKYCYKPINDKSCCPSYAIQCRAQEFKISKSQKKVLKSMNNFLSTGKEMPQIMEAFKQINLQSKGHHGEGDEPPPTDKMRDLNAQFYPRSEPVDYVPSSSGACKRKNTESTPVNNKQKVVSKPGSSTPTVHNNNQASPDVSEGQSADHVPRKKAKTIRLEKKCEKLKHQGMSEMEAKEFISQMKRNPVEKDLEGFMKDITEGNAGNRLEVKLVRTKPPSSDYVRTSDETFQLYKKFQVAIHKDDPDRTTKNRFESFLVNSPLLPCYPEGGPPQGYGSFHQQYWLDGTLVAVGVIDILPYCVSSVYFFYDPVCQPLSLGTFGSLWEIALTRQLSKTCPSLRYYYMGYYIHSCPKMTYKARYSPSYLLCPETYTWHPIEKCLPMLDKNSYSRFEENKNILDENGVVDVNKVIILHRGTVFSYRMYRSLKPEAEDDENVRLYSKLVGASCAMKMLLYRD